MAQGGYQMAMTAYERVQQQLEATKRLRATGPVSPSYTRWVDQTLDALRRLFGEDSWPVHRFQEAVGPRGSDDQAGLPLWGQWGLLARLARAEEALQAILDAPAKAVPAF